MSSNAREKASSQRYQQKVAHEIHKAIDAADSTASNLLVANRNYLIKHISNLKDLSSQVLDISNKRDYYHNKLLRLLRELAPNLSESNTTMPATDYTGPDPSQISNRYHATLYVGKRLLRSSANRAKIRDIIAHHLKAQSEWQATRQDLEVKYLDSVREMEQQVARKSEGYHPSKMLKMKKELTETRLKELSKNYSKTLSEKDQEIWRSCRALSMQLALTLREMNAPFFCTDKKFQYPQLKEDQEFLVARIQDDLAQSAYRNRS